MTIVTTGSKINFLDDRFFAKRESIWNQAGVTVAPAKASEAFQQFGEYEPVVAEQYSEINGQKVLCDTRAIFLPGVDGNLIQAGTVKGRYQMVTPAKFVEMWDKHVGLPVVAMGAAGALGQVFFLSSELGEFSIKGDPIQSFLMGVSPMTGQGSLSVRVTPVRMKCTNQMQASKSHAMISAKIGHTAHVLESAAAWMRYLKDRVKQSKALVEKDFNKLAEAAATPNRVQNFVETVYQLPRWDESREIGPAEVVERRKLEHKTHTNMVQARRDAFQNLLDGQMTGGDTLDMTMYRVYNAAVEQIQYWRGSNENERAMSSLLGKRGDEIEYAFDRALAIANSVE